jgi:hypothetical protein
MAEPNKPPLVPRPQQVVQLKSGETHVTLGCIMLVLGALAIAGLIYVFREPLVEHPFYAMLGVFIIWKIYDHFSGRAKGRDQR